MRHEDSKGTNFHIALLPGDGIGTEVTQCTVQVLRRVADRFDLRLTFEEVLVGGAAIDATGDPLPAATIEACERADAIFLGAVGGPRWSDPSATVRPEQGLLRLRSHFGLFANLRPIPIFPSLIPLAPLKSKLLQGVDLLFVRELTGGIYFGPRQEEVEGKAYDTMAYSVGEVERVAHVAFRAARIRRGKVTSVDKANVLASMRLWRRTVEGVAADYPDVELEHCLVDACAMRLLREPASFDVILAGNLFGDVLSDEASMLAGSLGMLPSAALGDETAERRAVGLYEPVHGSAPDITGQGKANPIAAVLTGAMLLRHSLGHEAAAQCVEQSVEQALGAGLRTADLAADGELAVTSETMTQAICELIDGVAESVGS